MKLYGLLVLVVVLHAGLTYAAQAQSSATEAPQSLPTIRVSPRVFSQLDCRPDGICKGDNPRFSGASFQSSVPCGAGPPGLSPLSPQAALGYKLRMYRLQRENPSSDVTHVIAEQTCARAGRYHVWSIGPAKTLAKEKSKQAAKLPDNSNPLRSCGRVPLSLSQRLDHSVHQKRIVELGALSGFFPGNRQEPRRERLMPATLPPGWPCLR